MVILGGDTTAFEPRPEGEECVVNAGDYGLYVGEGVRNEGVCSIGDRVWELLGVALAHVLSIEYSASLIELSAIQNVAFYPHPIKLYTFNRIVQVISYSGLLPLHFEYAVLYELSL